MNTFGRTCVDLRKQGLTLQEIARKTKRPKTSVYNYIQDIPLPEKTIKKFREENGRHIRMYALARNGISQRGFKKFNFWDVETVSLVGHLLFDGEIRRGHCSYNNRSEALLRHVRFCMKKIYRFEPRVYPNTVTGVTRISYFNVALAAFITQKSLELKEVIQKLPPQLQCEFLRSFFNDEGCVDFRVQKKIRRIRGYQKDVNILVLVRSLLHQQGIASHIEKPNEVVVSGKKNLILFQKKIGFSEGVRVNGSRSNSRWKQDLEKRLILRQAIDSFIT